MTSVAEFIATRLRAWGVDRVFGLPGRDTDALVTALRGGLHAPEFVQTRHEESAALMACAHAKLTGRPGCCLASSDAGALRLLSGLYDGALDRRPVVAVVAQEPGPGGDRGRPALPLSRLFADVSVYSELVTDPARTRAALYRAVRAARTERGVATLVVPRTLLIAASPADDDAAEPGPAHFRPRELQPEERDVRAAADVLNAGRRVAVVVGQGGARAAGHVVGMAELLGAAVAKTPLGRDVLPDDLPCVTGVAAAFGSAPARALLHDCDTLVLVGAHDLDSAVLPMTAARLTVVIGTDADTPPFGHELPVTVRVTSDVVPALEALIPLLERRKDRSWRADAERAVREWRAEGRAKSHRFFGMAINPRSVVAELSARLPERAVVITDSGSAMDWWTRHLQLRNGMRTALSGVLRMPGAAVPYAVAARLAFPERPVIALVGDGALQAGGMNELITVRRHRERFADLPPLVFCVLNNEDLSRLTWERRKATGEPRIPATGEVPAVSYTRYADVLGLPATRYEKPAEVAPAWENALAGKGPMVLEFLVDGEMPPDWAEPEASRTARHPSLRDIGAPSWRRRVATSVGDLFGSG